MREMARATEKVKRNINGTVRISTETPMNAIHMQNHRQSEELEL